MAPAEDGSATTRDTPGILETLILGIPGILGGLFWLGLFFLIAGMFVPKSLQKKGPWKFSQERIIHLGIPLIVYALVVIPLLKYAVVRTLGQTTQPPWAWALTHIRPLDAGPLWFVGTLMIFSVAYALYDKLWPGRPRGDATIRVRGLVLLALAIAGCSFLFRLVFPIYSDQFLGLHLWQWPQYVLLFWAGAWAAERGWPTLSDAAWRRCGYAILVAAVLGSVLILAVYKSVLPSDPGLYSGGWHWEALFAPVIEGVPAARTFGLSSSRSSLVASSTFSLIPSSMPSHITIWTGCVSAVARRRGAIRLWLSGHRATPISRP